MNLAVNNPNFSIVVPTGCNAECDFCFWQESDSAKWGLEYLRALNDTLVALPEEFKQCSITGGEPTTSGMLRDILILARLRFDKVVLTTNGYNLEAWMFEYVDHVNISRHHHDDYDNQAIFRTDTVPDSDILTQLCEDANKAGVDVTINTVVSADFNDCGFLNRMIQFTKDVNANALCIRKQHGNIEDLPVESNIPNKVSYEHSCGVCLIKERLIDGMKTTWRYSVAEPSNELGAIYELVFNQDCSITSDWAGNEEIHVLEVSNDWDEDEEMFEDADDEDTPIKTASFFGGGCGRVSSGGCGGF